MFYCHINDDDGCTFTYRSPVNGRNSTYGVVSGDKGDGMVCVAMSKWYPGIC